MDILRQEKQKLPPFQAINSKIANNLAISITNLNHEPHERETWFGPPGANLKAKLGQKNIEYQVRALERVEGSAECAAVLLEIAKEANVANRFTVSINEFRLARRCGMSIAAVKLLLHDLIQGNWITPQKTSPAVRLNTETVRRAYVATK